MEVTVHEAKSQLSKLLAKVSQGEEVIITSGKNRKPIARLAPIAQDVSSRIGFAKGVWPEVGPDFFDPLPDDELALWDGEGN